VKLGLLTKELWIREFGGRMPLDMSFWIQLAVYTVLAVLIPYTIYRIYIHFALRSEETPIMQRIRELELSEEEIEEVEEEKKPLEMETPKVEKIDEVSALAKAVSKVIFTEKEFTPDEILTLRRRGFIDFHGEYYLLNQNALNFAKNIIGMLKKAEEYNFNDFDWELFENGIRALGVIYFHKTKGPMLIPISNHFNTLSKLRFSPNELMMMKVDKITIGENTFIFHKVKVTSGRRPITHLIIAEALSEEKAKTFISRKALEIIGMAKQKIGD